MAEGRNIDMIRKTEEIQQGLEAFGKAVEKLRQIGLTRRAAIIHAGQMFDLRIDEEDVAPEPPSGSDDQDKIRRVS